MCLIICQKCNEVIGFQEHICDPEKIVKYIEELKKNAQDSENHLSEIKNCVFMMLKELPSLEGDSIQVSGSWMRRLWDAIQGRWYDAKDADTFMVHDFAKQNILCAAYDLFREKKNKTVLDKLKRLKEACESSVKALGYNTKPFTINPEDIVKA